MNPIHNEFVGKRKIIIGIFIENYAVKSEGYLFKLMTLPTYKHSHCF